MHALSFSFLNSRMEWNMLDRSDREWTTVVTLLIVSTWKMDCSKSGDLLTTHCNFACKSHGSDLHRTTGVAQHFDWCHLWGGYGF